MRIKLWKKREIWWPTRTGWLIMIIALVGAPAWWWFRGEEFLTLPQQAEADVLVVEGWIDPIALQTAADVFRDGQYRIVVATGGLTGESWTAERWSEAKIAFRALKRAGIPESSIILAQGRDTPKGRTYEMALATRLALEANGVSPEGVNVYTRGVHARRSCLVFEAVLGDQMDVGAIGWTPSTYDAGSWRESSERAKNFAEESLGYLYELLWSSGRSSSTLEEDLESLRSEALEASKEPDEQSLVPRHRLKKIAVNAR